MLQEREIWWFDFQDEQQERPRRQPTRRQSFNQGCKEKDDRGWTLLHIAARKGDLKEVRRLLDKGMDVNTPAWGPKSQGETPLHLAAQGGHIKVMDELLERVANIDAGTKGACGCTTSKSKPAWRPLRFETPQSSKHPKEKPPSESG